jgi:site-specific recombinase XerD
MPKTRTFQTPWYPKTIDALQLAGMSERTQECYARAVRMLLEYYDGKDPYQITEEELKAYFLYRRNTCKWSGATQRICHAGLKFFFRNVIGRDFPLFAFLKAKRERTLPCVLSREEVNRVLSHVSTDHNRACLQTIYSCGLRLQEGLFLQVSDIDADRMMIHVHRGKGAKDRFVPMPALLLTTLRTYWATHRNPRLIFPALGRGHQNAATSEVPMAIDSLQGAFRSAKAAAGITKRKVSVHTLRHSWATHMLERGVNVRVIQEWLGHARLETTMVYLHLTTEGREEAVRILNSLAEEVCHGHGSGCVS